MTPACKAGVIVFKKFIFFPEINVKHKTETAATISMKFGMNVEVADLHCASPQFYLRSRASSKEQVVLELQKC